MRIIDLTAPITTTPPDSAESPRTEVEYLDHTDGALEIETTFGVPSELLRDGEGWAREVVTLGTHSWTHVDAPYHYNSRVGGRPAATIDELPLERFFGPGVVVDMTAKADGETIERDEMEAGIAAAGHELHAGDIVLVHTGRDRYMGQDDYADRGPGASAAATRWLYEQGVRVMGVDAWGWDSPLRIQAERALAAGERGIFWEAHQVDLPYSQIERLVNLGALPPTGFTVACFPLRIHRASGAPARVVAILDR